MARIGPKWAVGRGLLSPEHAAAGKGCRFLNRSAYHYAWVILAVCFVDLFVNYAIRLGYGVVLPEMIRQLGFSRTAGGTVFNAYLLAYVILTPVTGLLTDLFGARRVISICALILGLGATLMGTAGGTWSAAAFFAITGLGATGMWTPVITVVQRWYSPRRRGLALGMLSTSYGLGFACVGVLFPWILAALNWRYFWYLLGAAALLMSAANAVFLRSDPESAGRQPWGDDAKVESLAPQDPGRFQWSLLRQVLARRVFWMIGFSYGTVAYCLYGITTYMVDYAGNELGIPMAKASLLATVHGVGQIVGVLTILPLSDRLGRRKTIMLSNASITACLAGILMVGSHWTLLWLLVGGLAVFYGVTFPIYAACAGEYFPREIMASVLGAWTPFYGLGAVMVHWVSGMIRDVTGSYQIPFMINIVMAALSLLLITRVGEAAVGHRVK